MCNADPLIAHAHDDRSADLLGRQFDASALGHEFRRIIEQVPQDLLQAALTSCTSGRWRKASLVPAVIMVPIVAFSALAFAAQSNLWPLLLILTAPLAFLYLAALGVILLLRRLARAT